MLQTKEEWEAWISKLQSQEKVSQLDRQEIAKLLAELIEKIILQQSQNQEFIGLLFSGGVDSTTIGYVLRKLKVPFTAMTIGFWDENQKEPEDILTAREIAQEMDFDYHEKIFDFEEMENLFEHTVKILGKELSDVVNVGVGTVEIAGIEQLNFIKPETRTIYGGLGSEEIYAGYQRHIRATNRHEECWKGLKLMFERDILRDITISKALNISFCTPFLHEEIIRYSMNIPDKYKVTETMGKVIFREAAIMLGLPEKYAMRPKKAAQYGSRIDNALEKISKRKGYHYKKDYIESLVNRLSL
jgi:asparagine synthase (glutamine-hydrolysing)